MKELKRKCVVCGRILKILINDRMGYYTGGHYFGKMKIPIGKGKWKKIGTSTILKSIQKITDIVEWSGKEKEVEYWECDKCYRE